MKSYRVYTNLGVTDEQLLPILAAANAYSLEPVEVSRFNESGQNELCWVVYGPNNLKELLKDQEIIIDIDETT
jgi:hypothetical protein